MSKVDFSKVQIKYSPLATEFAKLGLQGGTDSDERLVHYQADGVLHKRYQIPHNKNTCDICKKEATDKEFESANCFANGSDDDWYINDPTFDDCLICPSCLSTMATCGYCNEIFEVKELMATVEGKLMCSVCEDKLLKCKVCSTWQDRYETDDMHKKEEDFICIYCEVDSE